MSFKSIVITVIVGILAFFGAIYTISHLKKIDVGRVGVVYSMAGGVQDETLSQGFHFVSPFEHVKEFTVGNEQLILTKDKREGSKENDSFYVATSDNAGIAISFQMSYCELL